MNQVWIWGIALLLSVNAYGLQSRKITASAGAPIPTAYSSSNSQSLVWPSVVGAHTHIHINNTSASAVECMNGADNTTAPDQQAAVISEVLNIPATTQYVLDGFTTSKKFYCRSASGSTITSGDIIIHVW